jgi:protein-disulfide isomerase
MIKRHILAPALSLLWAAVPLAAAPISKHAAPQQDFMRVQETAQGGYAIGNPRAKLHMVEYISYTCPHCAHFTAEAYPELMRDYVATGKVRFEVRNANRDGLDFIAALTARCGGAAHFFALEEDILRHQDDIMAKVKSLKDSDLKGKPIDAVRVFVANITGIAALVSTHGIDAVKLKACLIDKAAQGKIMAMTKDAFETKKLSGTPAFIFNTQIYDGNIDWPSVKVALNGILSVL